MRRMPVFKGIISASKCLVTPDRRVLDAWIIGPTPAWLGFRDKQLALELGAFRPE